MQLGYSTWGMPKIPIDVSLAHLADLGFDGIELTVIPGYTTELARLDAAERRRIRGLLDSHHLALSAVGAHADMLVDDPAQLAQNMAQLRAGADLALDLAGPEGVPVVNTFAGGQSGNYAEKRQLLIDRIHDLLDYTAPRGVIIAMEPHVGSTVDMPEYVTDLMTAVNSPYMRVNFDISHFNVMGVPVKDSVDLLAPLAAHTHIKDERGIVPDFQFLIPGEGDFDYAQYLRYMQAAGYTGFITVEISTMVQRRPDYDALAAATQSYRVVSHAFEVAGIARAAQTRG